MIGGKYAVEGILGRGGMGLVLKARHLRLDEPVAIKVLHQSLASDPSMAARMLREARAALRLSSEHIVRVMDVDTLENGVPYMVLEDLEGYDVASLAKKRKDPMPWEHVVAIMDQACRALAEAHALGIVHRDLKPANLFIVKRPDGRRVVKLLDFGVSKLDLPREAPITKQGDILGSPRYMSPEQVKGMPLDGRSDIWSAGVVLYELLTGTAPFAAPNFAVACRRVLDETPTPLLTLRPDVPAGLAAAIERCLEKDRDRRFPDALALRDALAPFGVLSHRSGSQMTLPDIGELLSSDAPAPVIPPPSPSVAPAPSSAHDPLSSPSAPPPSAPPSAARGAPTPASSSGPPPSSGPASAMWAVADPSSPSLSADVRLSHDATAIAARMRSRRFRWIALAGLALGLAVGLTLLVRGRDATPAGDARAGEDSPEYTVSSAGGAGAVTPGSAAFTGVPAITAATASATSGAAATASPATSSAAPSTSSAPPEGPAEPGSKPWRRPSTTGTTAPKPPPTGADPFGERRQ